MSSTRSSEPRVPLPFFHAGIVGFLWYGHARTEIASQDLPLRFLTDHAVFLFLHLPSSGFIGEHLREAVFSSSTECRQRKEPSLFSRTPLRQDQVFTLFRNFCFYHPIAAHCLARSTRMSTIKLRSMSTDVREVLPVGRPSGDYISPANSWLFPAFLWTIHHGSLSSSSSSYSPSS